MKGEVRDAVTGRPLANAVITTRNVTRINETHARKDIIKHDITSGIRNHMQNAVLSRKGE